MYVYRATKLLVEGRAVSHETCCPLQQTLFVHTLGRAPIVLAPGHVPSRAARVPLRRVDAAFSFSSGVGLHSAVALQIALSAA